MGTVLGEIFILPIVLFLIGLFLGWWLARRNTKVVSYTEWSALNDKPDVDVSGFETKINTLTGKLQHLAARRKLFGRLTQSAIASKITGLLHTEFLQTFLKIGFSRVFF